MKMEKTKWAGDDDDNLDETDLPLDKNKTKVTMESQRIRMFGIDLSPELPPTPQNFMS